MNEEIDVTVKGLTPFKKFCMTIGELPSSYLETMSYYEMLMWFTIYLTDTVIPTVNNNAEAVEEVQNIVMQLQDYINHYFDNLDVQEEINEKLNSMALSGELANLINQDIFSDIQNKILQNTVDIHANSEELENTVKYNESDSITMTMLNQEVREALTGGSTAVVGVDTVGMENIKNKAITIYKLDDYLQSTKSISYGEPKELGERYAGFISEDNGYISVQTGNESYAHFELSVTKDKIYAFSGINTFNAYGLVIADQTGQIIYKSGQTVSNKVQPVSLIFRPNEDNLMAYVSIYKPLFDNNDFVQYFARYNTPLLREIEIFTNNYVKITPRLLSTHENMYLSWAPDSYGLPKVYSYNNTTFKIYEIVKGKKYHIHAWDWSNAVGIYILGLDNNIIYQSTTTPVGGEYVERNYTFTAQEDGYACLLERYQYKGEIEIIEDLIGENTPSEYVERLGFNKWYALGDSLTEVNFRASKNYVGYIQDELGITTVNLGHSSAGYMHTVNNVNFRSEIDEIVGYDYNSDIITVMGSINDFQHIGDLGQLGDTDTNTIYGCIYTFCNNLFTKYIGARVGIICPPPNNIYHSNYATYTAYNTAIKETAKLFSIPVLDLSEKSNLKPWIQAFQTEFFTADGTGNTGQSDQTHPNSKGHWLLHNEIKEFLKTL